MATMPPPPPRRAATPRRGMLLLLVLSVLALFIVIGAVGILLALRARESARAFAAAANGTAGSTAVARAQLDEALLKLIRGPSDVALTSGTFESLLEDKYGASGTSCTVTALTGTTGGGYFASAIGTVTVTGLDTSNPAAIAGRVLTFVPVPNDPTGPTSYRILRAGAGAGTLLLANTKPSAPLRLPSVFPCEAVINGREFSGTGPNDKHEPWDAFDDKNPYLTHSGTLSASRVQQVTRPAFGATGTACTVDNDGDGTPDGVWLENVLPPQPSTDGGQLSFAVSYLVLDLDGRINVNAHGSFVRAQTVTSTSTYPARPTPFVSGSGWTISGTIPLGMGYGPADVDASLLVSTAAEATSGTVPARWALLVQGGTMTQNAITSSTTQWRPAPWTSSTVPIVQSGRYGLGAAAPPGGGTVTGTNPLHADWWMVNPPGNSPTDLKARLQVFTTGSAAGPKTLAFVRPQTGPAWTTPTGTDDVVGSGTTAHPYALRLDDDAARAAGGLADDAPYTVGELERILRPFDADAATLAPRLAAMLDDIGERSRMTVTTDSWDTPALTGAAAQAIAALTGTTIYNVLSPETVAGLRFNLNRPISSGTAARFEYFRQLYALARALGVPAADAAQWAANVIEFRDPDSIMTWYPYDTNPFDADGFTTGAASPGVWGAERPEMAITSATYDSVTNKVAVSLFRPWAAQLVTGTTLPGATTTELIDASLGDRTANTLTLTGTVGDSAIWRLAIVGSATTDLGSLLPAGSGTTLATNTGLTVSGTAANQPPQVVLLRLANPTAAVNAGSNDLSKNDYVPVHTGAVAAVGAAPATVQRWLHWPNRDFVSHGELLALQSGSAADLGNVLTDASANGSSEQSLAGTNPLLLDATIVPSRFVGAAVSVGASGSAQLAAVGMQSLRHGQFSRWREPGRVNVNTILSSTGNTPSQLDNVVRTALMGLSGAANPVTASGTYAPLKTDSELLLLTGSSADFVRSGTTFASSFLKRGTAVRLASSATVRSHVFAVWITVRITDSSPSAGSPQYARLFAIVDRSIPVGYAPGRTLNVRDTIRLQRFLP